LIPSLIPSFLGLDIGCGVVPVTLEGENLRLINRINLSKRISLRSAVRDSVHEDLEEMNAFTCTNNRNYDFAIAENFKRGIEKLCEKQGKNPERVFVSLGSLECGNHFIEIDIDENHNCWLLIYSDSRIFGANTAEFHEIPALRETDANSPVKYLSVSFLDD
jgi:hypothetical protein